MRSMRFQLTLREEDYPELYELLSGLSPRGRSEMAKRFLTNGYNSERGMNLSPQSNSHIQDTQTEEFTLQYSEDLLGDDLATSGLM